MRIYLWTARLLPAIFGLAKIVLARKYLTEPTLYISAVSIFVIITAVSAGWLNNSIMRFGQLIGSNFNDKFWRIALVTLAIISLISVPICILLLPSVSPFPFFLWIVLQTFLSVCSFIYWSRGNMKSFAIISSLTACVDLFIMVIFHRSTHISLNLLLSASSFLFLLLSIIYGRLTWTNSFSTFSIARSLSYGAPLSLALLITSLNIHIDRIILTKTVSSLEVVTFITLYALIDQGISSYVQVENQKLQSSLFSIAHENNSLIVNSIMPMIAEALKKAGLVVFVGYFALLALKLVLHLTHLYNILIPTFVLTQIYFSIGFFRLSQIANKYFELKEKTIHFFVLLLCIFIIKLIILYTLYQINGQIINDISLSGLICNIILFVVCLSSMRLLVTKPHQKTINHDL